MKISKFEEHVVEKLTGKIQNPENDMVMSNVIYNFLNYKDSSTWDCKNIDIIGAGEIVKSNNLKISEMLNTLQYLEENYNVLIVQNKETLEFNCLLLPPTKNINVKNKAILKYDHPVFENIKQDGTVEKDNWIIENQYKDQVEIYPSAFTNRYNFYNMLSPNLQKFNDKLIDEIKTNSVETFSKIYYSMNPESKQK